MLQGERSCACSAGLAVDPPTAATVMPIPAKRAGGAGRKRQKMQKVNTIVLELECVLCGLVAAADLQLSGGPAGRVQQERINWSDYKDVYTGIYLDIQSTNKLIHCS